MKVKIPTVSIDFNYSTVHSLCISKLLITLVLSSLSFNSLAMIRALNTAATGMAAQESNVNTISNNIANVNTNAYKAQRTEFEDLTYQTITQAGSRSSDNTEYTIGHQIGSGTKVTATRRLHTMGSPKITNGTYDIMIMGEGFFGVQVGNNTYFTRDGSFSVDAQGIIKTKSGYPLLPVMTVPPNTKTLHIAEDGKVEAFINNQAQPVALGNIPVFTFVNPAGLTDLGGNLARFTRASGSPIQNTPGIENAGSLQQGAIEMSNVSVMSEMTDLIKAQRAYEMNSKVMGVADQMLQTVNNIR
jgi:flagellar basal-body rod protein FlgG